MTFDNAKRYLMIENPGVCPSECFTLLGVSTTRNAEVEGTIGTFGSGSKNAINLFLRESIAFSIYCGSLRLEFETKGQDIDDNLINQEFNRVCVIYTGKTEEGKMKNRKKEPLGWVLELGEMDWSDVSMGVREFVANAFDRCLRQTGSFKEVVIEVVPQNKMRAKTGGEHTRVFIEYTPEVEKYHRELNNRFLFASTGQVIKPGLLHKVVYNQRNMTTTTGPVFYRNGVYVREDHNTELPSIFDYNFGNDVQLNESRTLDSYTVKEMAAEYVTRYADQSDRSKLIQTFIKRNEHWEHELYGYGLTRSLRDDAIKTAWKNSWPEGFIPCSSEFEAMLLFERGKAPVLLPEGWYHFFKEVGIESAEILLTPEERNKIDLVEVPTELQQEYDNIWDVLEGLGYTNGKEQPALKLYRKVEATEKVKGYYRDNTVFINDEYGGRDRRVTILEEYTHHITGCGDLSRGFQEFLLILAVENLF